MCVSHIYINRHKSKDSQKVVLIHQRVSWGCVKGKCLDGVGKEQGTMFPITGAC